MNNDSVLLRLLREDFEKSFPYLTHTKIHDEPIDPAKMRYESMETEHAWQAWVSSYETYVGSTM